MTLRKDAAAVHDTDALLPLKTEVDVTAHFGEGHYSRDASHPGVLGVIKEDASALVQAVDRTYRSICNTASGVGGAKGFALSALNAFPFYNSVKGYQKSFALFDVSAGLVEGVMKVPQGLAYATLANMPSQYGLYTSLMPPFLYMLFGTCQQLSFGVTAIEAILLADSVRGVIGSDIADSEDPTDVSLKVQYTLFFSFMVGIWQLLFRLFQCQFLGALLSDPVMSGFATGGAFIVATTQINGLTGLKLPNEDMLFTTWKEAWQQRSDWNWTAIWFCVSGVFFLLILQFLNKRLAPRWPMPWQVPLVIFAILITAQMQLHEKHNLAIVGTIPPNFPKARFPSEPTIPGKSNLFRKSLLPTFIVSVFVYVMSLTLAKVFARKNGYEVKASKELFAIGFANTISSMTGSFICSASFSRTAVVSSIGAKTVLHNVPALAIMVLALTTITDQLYNLPKCILASVVFVGLKGLAEPHEFIRYYCVSKPEFIIWNVTFWLCLTEGAVVGIGIGIAAALLYVLLRYTIAKTVILGRLPGTTVYRNVQRFPMAEEVAGVKIMRFDASLNFANWESFTNTLANLATKDIHTVVVDASSINEIDTSSMRGLVNLVEDFDKRGVALYFSNWKGPQRDMLERSAFYDQVKRESMFLTLHDAVVYAQRRGSLSPSKAPDTVVEVMADGHEHKWKVAYPEGSTHDEGKDPESTH